MSQSAARGEAQEFLRRALSISGDECVLWPFASLNGLYGQIKYRGKTAYVHRIICFAVRGEPPSEEHEAAHTCRHGLCVNPNHIWWNLPRDISARQIERGTRPTGEDHPRAKLTETAVREIRGLKGQATEREIAAAFLIGATQAHRILAKENWRNVV